MLGLAPSPKMRIFLSYPHEYGTDAEMVATRLRVAGHRVFFAPEQLAPGQSYDDRIQADIRASDLIIFFLGPEFFVSGRYTLSELAIAKKQWPSPSQHALPVVLHPIAINDLPAYLRAVTILEPKGDVAAEIVSAVAELGRPKTQRLMFALGGFATILLAFSIAMTLLHQENLVKNHGQIAPILSRTPQAPTAFRLTDTQTKDFRELGSWGANFWIASKAGVLVSVGPDGKLGPQIQVPGHPIHLAIWNGAAYVASENPNAVTAVDLGKGTATWTLPVSIPSHIPTAFNEQISSRIHSIAVAPSGVWVVTGEGSGSVLARADLNGKGWYVPSYQKDVDFELRDIALTQAAGQVWGAETNSTPGNLYVFNAESHHVFNGHDVDPVSCATDVSTADADHVYIVDCKGRLLVMAVNGSGLETQNEVLTWPDWQQPETGIWITYILVTSGASIVIAQNIEIPNSDVSHNTWRCRIMAANPSSGKAEVLAEITGVHVVSIAVVSGVTMAVVEHSDGSHSASAFQFNP
jgi:hypothetical protein